MPRLSHVEGLFGPVSGRSRRRFNLATGGTETTVSNYNGTGETWRVHTFTTSGTLTVSVSTGNWSYLACAGGGSNGGGSSYGGAGAGGLLEGTLTAAAMPPGSYSFTVGAAGGNTVASSIGLATLIAGGNGSNHATFAPGGGGGSGGGAGGSGGGGPGGFVSGGAGTSGQGNAGGGLTTAAGRGGGGGGGRGGAGQTAGGGTGGNGGAAHTSTITGSSRPYSAGTGGGGTDFPSVFGAGSTPASDYGRGGQPGVVIIAYRIG